mgnify:CR=1 FL=1
MKLHNERKLRCLAGTSRGIFCLQAQLLRATIVPLVPPRPATIPLSFDSFHKLVSRTETRFTALSRPTTHKHQARFLLAENLSKKCYPVYSGTPRFPDPCATCCSEESRSSKRGQTEASLVNHWLETGKLHVARTIEPRPMESGSKGLDVGKEGWGKRKEK